MRTVRLAAAAAQAEKLRLEALVRRQSGRAALALAAVVFAVGALCFGHIAAGLALAAHFGLVRASLWLLGFDLLVAIALFAVAMRWRPGAIETEAQLLKVRALTQIKREMWISTLRLGIGLTQASGRLVLAELVSRLLSGRSARDHRTARN